MIEFDLDLFTEEELDVIFNHRTPGQVQKFLDSLKYNQERDGETIKSFRRVLREGNAHCLEGVITAATILGIHGFETRVLDLSTNSSIDHVVYLYKSEKGKYGSVAKSEYPEAGRRPAVFNRVGDLAMSYRDSLRKYGPVLSYAVVDLEDIPRANWRFSERNLWKVQDYLSEARHRRLSEP